MIIVHDSNVSDMIHMILLLADSCLRADCASIDFQYQCKLRCVCELERLSANSKAALTQDLQLGRLLPAGNFV